MTAGQRTAEVLAVLCMHRFGTGYQSHNKPEARQVTSDQHVYHSCILMYTCTARALQGLHNTAWLMSWAGGRTRQLAIFISTKLGQYSQNV